MLLCQHQYTYINTHKTHSQSEVQIPVAVLEVVGEGKAGLRLCVPRFRVLMAGVSWDGTGGL